MGFHRPGPHIHSQVAAKRGVVHHVLLEHLPFVAQGNVELLVAVMGIVAHDVPDNGPATNLDHRLGLNDCLFCQAGSFAAGQNGYFHDNSPRKLRREKTRG